MQDRTAYPYLGNICTWQLVEFNTAVGSGTTFYLPFASIL